MTRSQEALEKRAEKRSVPVEEQRLKDSRKKARKEGDVGDVVLRKKLLLKKKSSDAKIQIIQDTNDWICIKCTNKNFHHRETCNRCQSSRVSQALIATADAAPTSSRKPAETKKIPPLTTVTSNTNWTCLSCKNDNFPTRTECNRCQTDRPASSSTSCSKLNSDLSKVKVQAKAPPADRIPKGMGLISGKSLSWGKQATEIELAENRRLREVSIFSSNRSHVFIILKLEFIFHFLDLPDRNHGRRVFY